MLRRTTIQRTAAGVPSLKLGLTDQAHSGAGQIVSCLRGRAPFWGALPGTRGHSERCRVAPQHPSRCSLFTRSGPRVHCFKSSWRSGPGYDLRSSVSTSYSTERAGRTVAICFLIAISIFRRKCTTCAIGIIATIGICCWNRLLVRKCIPKNSLWISWAGGLTCLRWICSDCSEKRGCHCCMEIEAFVFKSSDRITYDFAMAEVFSP